MGLLKVGLALFFLVLAGLLLWRLSDAIRAHAAWARLANFGEAGGDAFSPDMVAELPEPARRYFGFSIAPGTKKSRVAVFEMTGELGLGTKEDPGYRPMTASQVLAPPYGLVWRLRAGPVSGSDGALPETSWTRFWLFNLIPVARISGDEDHHLSAFGRVVSEAAIWTPGALLPSQHVTWEAVDEDTARAIVTFGEMRQSVDISVGADGAPLRVEISRWSSANDAKEYQWQPFGGFLGEHREFGGYRVPTKVEGGNMIGTDAYFPFFKAKVTSMDFR